MFVCIHMLPYHRRVSQVKRIPAKSLWKAVGLLTNVVFVRLNGAM